MADTQEHIEQSKNLLIALLERLGYFINFKKSSLFPNCSIKFIGYHSYQQRERHGVARINKLKHCIKRAIKSGIIVARALARIAGQIISMCKVFLAAKLLLRNIYRLLASKNSWQQKLTIDKATAADLAWWLAALNSWNGRAFKKEPQSLLQLTTDASGRSWGGELLSVKNSKPRVSGIHRLSDCLPMQRRC